MIAGPFSQFLCTTWPNARSRIRVFEKLSSPPSQCMHTFFSLAQFSSLQPRCRLAEGFTLATKVLFRFQVAIRLGSSVCADASQIELGPRKLESFFALLLQALQ